MRKEDLLIDTTFDHSQFLLDSTFKHLYLLSDKQSLFSLRWTDYYRGCILLCICPLVLNRSAGAPWQRILQSCWLDLVPGGGGVSEDITQRGHAAHYHRPQRQHTPLPSVPVTPGERAHVLNSCSVPGNGTVKRWTTLWGALGKCAAVGITRWLCDTWWEDGGWVHF
jgi:hypothetical protein